MPGPVRGDTMPDAIRIGKAGWLATGFVCALCLVVAAVSLKSDPLAFIALCFVVLALCVTVAWAGMWVHVARATRRTSDVAEVLVMWSPWMCFLCWVIGALFTAML